MSRKSIDGKLCRNKLMQAVVKLESERLTN